MKTLEHTEMQTTLTISSALQPRVHERMETALWDNRFLLITSLLRVRTQKHHGDLEIQTAKVQLPTDTPWRHWI